MSQLEHIKSAFERSIQALTLRPSVGQGTATTTVRVRDGMSCEIEEGAWTIASDLGEKAAGRDTGPNPGILLRAALGSCLAIGYVRWAAHLGVPISDLEVEVQADYDARGEYGVADLSPGYSAVRYVVRIESEAPEADVRHLIDTADAHTSILDVFRRPQSVRRTLHITTPTRTPT
jgi:uncharacterized OsmC-like protein